MPRRSIALDSWEKADGVGSGKSSFNQGEVLFGKLRPYFHKVGIAPVSGLCSTDILVFLPTHERLLPLVLMYSSSDEFVQFSDAGSHGTRMPRASWGQLAKYPISLPPTPVIEVFDAVIRPLLMHLQINIFESHTIRDIRDALLPKLLSGEMLTQRVEST